MSTSAAAAPAAMRPADMLIAVLVVVIWGANFSAMRLGALDIPPYFLLGLRLAIAAAILVWFLERPRGRFVELLAIATTMATLHFGLAMVGFRVIEASTGAIVMQTAVPFASLLAWGAFGERLGWRRLSGMAVAFGGIVLIVGQPKLGDHVVMAGVLAFSAFCFALANILIRRMGRMNIMSLNGWVAVLAAPQAFVISLLFEDGQIAALGAASWQALAALGYMAVVASVLAHTLWFRLVPRYETNQTMPWTLLVPVLGVVFGVALLEEQLTLMTVIGGLVTIAGVTVIVLRRPDTVVPAAAGSQT